MAKKVPYNKIIEEFESLTTSITERKAIADENLHTLDLITKGLTLFTYKNTPVESRLIETILFRSGSLVFFNHETLGYFALPYSIVGGLNVYGEPTKVRPIVVGDLSPHFNMELTVGEDCVLIRDNYLKTPPLLYAQYYGKKIAQLFSDREKNNTWLRLPMIFGSKGDIVKDTKTLKQATSILLDDGTSIAVVTDLFNLLETINIKIQYLGGEIQEQIKVVKNEYLEFLGIDHNEEKRERKTTTEVLVENESNSINLMKRYLPRLEAIESINKMFNLNIEITINNDNMATETNIAQQSVDSKAELFKMRGWGEIWKQLHYTD